MAIGAARSGICHQKLRGCRQQCSRCGRRPRSCGRLHALDGRSSECRQRTLFENQNFNLIRDIAAIAGLVRFPNVMEVNPSFSAKTVQSSSSMPKPILEGSIWHHRAVGTTQHLAGELFKIMTGVVIVHVPYRGSAPMLTDLLSGHVHGAFDPIPGSIEHIKSGRLHALAMTGATRLEALPDIAALSDFVPGFEASAWFGLGAPKSNRRSGA